MTSLSAYASKRQAGPSVTGYRPEIDGLRAVAIAVVIAHHFSDRLLPGGFLGVDMFFVISGYVITWSLAEHRYESFKELILGFYSRRIKRLAPALITCVVITCLLGDLFISRETSEHLHSFQAGGLALFGLSNFFFFKSAMDYFGSSAALNLFTQTWSLGVEEQFYLVFPALVWLTGGLSLDVAGRRRRLVAALVVLTALSLGLLAILETKAPSAAYFLMPPRLWELSVGCLIAIARLSPKPASASILDAGMSWMPLPASLVIGAAMATSPVSQLASTIAVVLGTAALIFTLQPRHTMFRLLTRRGVVLIGLMSYSLYLWHWSILSISRWTIGISWWTAPIQLAVMLSMAAASYVYIERPLRRAEWSASRLKTIILGLASTACAAGLVAGLGWPPVASRLYVGTSAKLDAKGATTMLSDRWRDGHLLWHARDCVLSSNAQVPKRIDAGECTVKSIAPDEGRRFLVIGNSYSAAEFEMYTALTDAGLGSVIVTSAWAASPVPEIPNASPWSKANDYYWSSVVPGLIAQLSKGDVVVLIADLQGMTPAVMSASDRESLSVLKSGLTRLANDLGKSGIQFIVQNGFPFIRDAGCTPDMAVPQWFNFGQPGICTYYSKAQSLERRQPLTQVLSDIAATHANFHTFDLFPVLCPGEVCRFYNEDRIILYRDVWSHASVEANYLARPAFLSVAREAISAARGAGGNREQPH